MNIMDILINRRSIRKYKNEKIERDTLEELVKAGMYAPSAVNKQPWHFIIVDDPLIMNRIADVHPNAQMLRHAAAAIVVVADKEASHGGVYWPLDCSAATQNILLAAHGKGLGSVWLGVYPREERVKGLNDIFNLPEGKIAFSAISLGYPAEEKPVPERFHMEKIHFNTFSR
ncbi:MAG: nitroreductase family protein [Bacteroidota bacterium]